MVNVSFCRFAKKPNSTARPSGSDAQYDCDIYDSCGLLAPVLIISDYGVIDYNYCYIDEWGRYYWVRDMEFREGRIFAHLEVDVLATYRNAIGASSQYIARSGMLSDPSIQDRVYVSRAQPTYNVQSASNPLNPPISGGRYIVGVNGSQTAYYAVSESQLGVLLSYIFSDSYADEVMGDIYTDIYPELKAQLNPLQYIASLRWVPFPITGKSTAISVGWVRTPAIGQELGDKSVPTASLTFKVPRHPQGGTGSYLNTPPYAEYQLYYPPFGMLQLPSDVMAITDSIYCEVMCDVRTGSGILTISRQGAGEVFCRVESKVGVEIQLAQITAPGYGAGSIIRAAASGVSGLANIVSSALQGGPSGVASAIGSGANLVGNITQSFGDAAAGKIPSVNTIGSDAGFAGLVGDCQLISTFLPIVARDPTHKGSPLCQVKTISEAGGYCEVYWPHLEVVATDTELTRLYAYMEGGFYYE